MLAMGVTVHKACWAILPLLLHAACAPDRSIADAGYTPREFRVPKPILREAGPDEGPTQVADFAADTMTPDAEVESDITILPEGGLLSLCQASTAPSALVVFYPALQHTAVVAQGSWKTLTKSHGTWGVDTLLLDNQTAGWFVEFSSKGLAAPLAVGHYPNAQRHPFEQPGHPGLTVSAASQGCNKVCGWFAIDSISIDQQGLKDIKAIFARDCECSGSFVMGCIRYRRGS